MDKVAELHRSMSVGKGCISISDADSDTLERFDALKTLKHFIVQKKTSMDYFSWSNVTHEVLDPRKNVLFRATRPKSFLTKPKDKIIVRNLRNTELFRLVIEPTNNLDGTKTEATIYIYPKCKIAHVEIYGGVYSQRSYEIFNKGGQIAFTIDPVVNKTGNSMMIEYDVSTKTGNLANIMMKTGLNCILSTDECANVLEKSTLIAVVLGMDLLKNRSTGKVPSRNQYAIH
ncbi:hypothetical protein Ocin01_10129 [Orchesella cincta]|uniref:Phospholipid scramblase n=1 Tax=Orchesella cincta TaxID=48709 RepID=A0A1D2MTZ9_ORCCI|nr:hypothetical protein Ocin01_10129 [Orchesella cincta]